MHMHNFLQLAESFVLLVGGKGGCLPAAFSTKARISTILECQERTIAHAI